MKERWLRPALFCCVALVQLTACLSPIVGRELALRHGALFKFRTAPVDPYDAFRGRYIALGFDQTEFTAAPGENLQRGGKAYASLTLDSDGFAVVDKVHARRPAGKYLVVKVWYVKGGQVGARLPFDRYYVPEHMAAKAEEAYRDSARREPHESYVAVRIRGDAAVLEELYIEEMPIEEYVKAHPLDKT
ncbi:MAG: GDYXXLXY domain-containing protein [Bacteroidota bacterium]